MVVKSDVKDILEIYNMLKKSEKYLIMLMQTFLILMREYSIYKNHK